MASVVEVAINSVWPSGSDLATRLGAERGRASRPVLDLDGDAESALEPIGNQAAEKIGGAVRRIRHDHP